MFGLWVEWPVSYTVKYYKEIETRILSNITTEIQSNHKSLNLKSNSIEIKQNSTTIKADNKISVTLNIKPNANN